MSSKKAMKKMQKLAFQKHKNNIRNNKFSPKTNKIFNKHKKWKNFRIREKKGSFRESIKTSNTAPRNQRIGFFH